MAGEGLTTLLGENKWLQCKAFYNSLVKSEWSHLMGFIFAPIQVETVRTTNQCFNFYTQVLIETYNLSPRIVENIWESFYCKDLQILYQNFHCNDITLSMATRKQRLVQGPYFGLGWPWDLTIVLPLLKSYLAITYRKSNIKYGRQWFVKLRRNYSKFNLQICRLEPRCYEVITL